MLDDVEIEPDRLAAFDRVCGYSLTDYVPAAYIHILAFPLALKLMTDGSFPLAAIGLVHIANKITQHRAVRIGERVSLRVWATELEPHPRGKQFTLRSQARVGDELVWEEEAPNLRRGGGNGDGKPGKPGKSAKSGKSGKSDKSGKSGKSAKPRDFASTEDLPATATWSLPGDLGRRYAAVSGDRNPIHVHPLSAKLFGFPTAIAHGMWTKARCLTALAPRLDEAFTAEVEFRKPILLPAKVKFAEEAREGAIRFGVRDARKGTAHVDGLVSLR